MIDSFYSIWKYTLGNGGGGTLLFTCITFREYWFKCTFHYCFAELSEIRNTFFFTIFLQLSWFDALCQVMVPYRQNAFWVWARPGFPNVFHLVVGLDPRTQCSSMLHSAVPWPNEQPGSCIVMLYSGHKGKPQADILCYSGILTTIYDVCVCVFYHSE